MATIEDKVVGFFRENRGVFVCDRCVAEKLSLGAGRNKSMAGNATRTLGALREYFDRGERTCSSCGGTAMATRWRAP